MAFIFGGNTGMSYEEMMRQRDLASQLAGQIGQGGLTALGAGLASGILARRSDKAQTKGREAAQGRAQSVLGQLFGQQVMGGQPMQGGGAMPLDPMDPTAIAGDTMAALGKDSGTAGYRQSLIGTESGGNWKAQNSEMGAGGQAGHFGRVQFGHARLKEAMDAGAIPQGTTPEQFMNSPALQIAAENWHFGDLENQLGDLVGREVNGRVMDMGALVAMGHLGGAGGARRYVESGGRYNPSDSFGTSLAEYAQTHGGQQTTMSAQNGPQGVDMSGLVAAMSDPYLDEGTRSVLGQLFQQQMQRQDPSYQMGMQADQLALEKAQLELDQMRNPQPGYRTLTPQEAQQIGLPEGGVYQVGPDGQIETVREPAVPEAPEMTSDMQEYEFARSQGYDGTFQQYMTEMKRAGATSINNSVTSGSDVGTIPQGYELFTDPNTGARSMRPIAGGPEDKTATNAAKASGAATASDVIVSAAKRATGANENRVAGGIFGYAASFNPSTQNAEVYRQVDVLKSNAKVEKLQQMRDESPTGGALGSVTEGETKMLADQAGALDPASPNFQRDLMDYTRNLLRTVHGREAGDAIFAQEFGSATQGAGGIPEGVDPADWEAMTEEERALWK